MNDASAREIGEWLAALCDGHATEQQRAALADRLRRDPAARDFYYRYLELHGLLQWPHVADQPPPLAKALSRSGGRRSPILGFLFDSLPGSLPALTTFSRFPLIVGVLLATMFWAAIAVWIIPSWRAPAGVADAPPARPMVVGRLTGIHDCVWEPSTPGGKLGEDVVAGSLRLVRGTAELTFANGVRVTIEGPTQLELESPAKTFLREGRLCAKVPAGATGYTVATSHLTVIDLGTEFGVETTADGQTNVQVFVGRVVIKPQPRPDVPPLTEMLVIGASESKRIERDAVTGAIAPRDIPASARPFRRVLPPEAQRDVPRFKPSRSLVAYWNFDEQQETARDQCGRNHGILTNVSRIMPGLIGPGALQFDHQQGQMVLVPPAPSDFKFSQAVTIEALFTCQWPGLPDTYAELLRQEEGDAIVLLSFQNDQQGPTMHGDPVAPQPVLAFGLKLAGQYKELELPLDGRQGRPDLNTLRDGRLHYVAAMYDSATGRKAIFLDGRLHSQEMYPRGTEMVSGATAPLVIGNTTGGNEAFQGMIDEVALYGQALTDDEVAAHWRNVSQGKGYFQLDAAAPGPAR